MKLTSESEVSSLSHNLKRNFEGSFPRTETSAWAALIIAGVLLANQFVMIRFLHSQEFAPCFAIFYASLLCMLFALPVLCYQRAFSSAFYVGAQICSSCLLALFSGVTYLTLTLAMVSIDLGDGMSLFIVFVPIWLTIQQPNLKGLFAIFYCSLVGVMLILCPPFLLPFLELFTLKTVESPTYGSGHTCIIISVLFATFSALLANSSQHEVAPISLCTICVLGNIVCASIYSFVSNEEMPTMNLKCVGSLVVLAATMLLTFYFFGYASKRITITFQIIAFSFEPLYSYIFGYILFSEEPDIFSAIGWLHIWLSCVIQSTPLVPNWKRDTSDQPLKSNFSVTPQRKMKKNVRFQQSTDGHKRAVTFQTNLEKASRASHTMQNLEVSTQQLC